MSEVWNKDSVIEERESKIRTPQLNQLSQSFSISDIYEIIRKKQYKGKIDDHDYKILCFFIDSKYAVQFKDLVVYVKEYFGDELKNRYFRLGLARIKKTDPYIYKTIYDYLINGLESSNIITLKNCLYKLMIIIPKIFKEDMLSKEYKEKIEKVLSKEEIIEKDNESSIIQSNKFEDSFYQKRLLNEDFKNKITKGMPNDYTNLEKSIYIYVRLCQLLSYDPKYYTDKNRFIKVHEDFDNYSEISIEKNDVICYEFAAIYFELLKDLGIDVKTTIDFDFEEDESGRLIVQGFNDKHAYVKYAIDGIYIKADSTISVLQGDLINAKMNRPLTGLKCLSVDQDKKDMFNRALNKVYEGLKSSNTVFKQYGEDIKEKPLTERLKELFDDITDSEFNPTDFISYIASIKHELFTDYELGWNLRINFIGKKVGDNEYPVVLFSVNTNNIKNVKEDTVQYLYDPYDKKVRKMEKQELEELFQSGNLFLFEDYTRIPNVSITKKQ